MKSKLLCGFLIAALVATSAVSPAAADERYRIGRGGITSSQGEHRGSYQNDSRRNDHEAYKSYKGHHRQGYSKDGERRGRYLHRDFIGGPVTDGRNNGVNGIPWNY